MKKSVALLSSLGCILASPSHATDLKQSKLTQVVNDVQIISAANQNQKAASLNDIFAMPDILRTGNASRAELTASDATITRVGANTIFSFDPANRTIDLKQGSLLFHAPHGKGGGTIHTGSATASVLGTTLIITTTPNGGFKVLALEGEVEVRFLNGLKQKLDPGQMTFILPGANQLAPVVIFRLDELTANSLLINGFSDTLDSMPLIQQEIQKQLRKILSGRYSDTGLYAGDDASPNQVEVLDINTIIPGQGQKNTHDNGGSQLPPPPPAPPSELALAMGADATINQPSLTDASVPTPPNHVFTASSFNLPDNSQFSQESFTGFLARNIDIYSTGEGSLSVNLSPYAQLPEFDLVAAHNLSISGSVSFDGLPTSAILALIAGNQLILAPGTALHTGVQELRLASGAPLTLDNVTIYNYNYYTTFSKSPTPYGKAGDILLSSGGAVSIENGSIIYTAGNLTVNGDGDVSVSGNAHLITGSALLTSVNGSVTLDNATLNATYDAIFSAPTKLSFNNSAVTADSVSLTGAGNAQISLLDTVLSGQSEINIRSRGDVNIASTYTPLSRSLVGYSALSSSGSVNITSDAGSVNISGTSITARYLTINSGDGILLDGAGQAFYAPSPSSAANLTAKQLITVNNADLSSFGTVNMAANTVNLYNVAFGDASTVTLKSLNGVLAPNPNTGAASVPGDVNFLYNVTYGGSPAQNYVNNGGGITITTLH